MDKSMGKKVIVIGIIFILSIFGLYFFKDDIFKCRSKNSIKTWSRVDLKKYEKLNPFWFKGILAKSVDLGLSKLTEEEKQEVKFLDAGVGNPNFLNTVTREAFCYLSLFSIKEAQARYDFPSIGLKVKKSGIAKRLENYLDENHQNNEAASYLKKSIKYAQEHLNITPDDFVHELVDAALGDTYPTPPRMLRNTEKVVVKYLNKILERSCDRNCQKYGNYNLFATEGSTAGIFYSFMSLRINKLLKKRDKIALISPTYVPYLEIPELAEYDLVKILVETDADNHWQLSQSEVDKLKDKGIKVLIVVNPGNPTSYFLNLESLKKIQKVVKKDRKDLIILSDIVYAPFVDEFYSLVDLLPYNTLCLHSFSKFFGATGWRLGVAGLYEKNVVDTLISKLPKEETEALDRRYNITNTGIGKLSFIDRMMLDSREVVSAVYAAGLSCPQQCMMNLFSMFYLLDEENVYEKKLMNNLDKRGEILHESLGEAWKKDPENINYYCLVDVLAIAQNLHGEKFADYLRNTFDVRRFLLRLAQEKYTICLPGDGFAAPEWHIRISLVNLEDDDYVSVGKNIKEVLGSFYKEWTTK